MIRNLIRMLTVRARLGEDQSSTNCIQIRWNGVGDENPDHESIEDQGSIEDHGSFGEHRSVEDRGSIRDRGSIEDAPLVGHFRCKWRCEIM